MQTVSYFPGQIATFLLEVKDNDGYRVDSATTPVITRVFGFNGVTSADGYTLYDGYFSPTDGYQQPMTKVALGLYYAKATLPRLASSIGTYLVDIQYTSPITSFLTTETYQAIINAPFGQFGSAITL